MFAVVCKNLKFSLQMRGFSGSGVTRLRAQQSRLNPYTSIQGLQALILGVGGRLSYKLNIPRLYNHSLHGRFWQLLAHAEAG